MVPALAWLGVRVRVRAMPSNAISQIAVSCSLIFFVCVYFWADFILGFDVLCFQRLYFALGI